jgi:hypothetical protein
MSRFSQLQSIYGFEVWWIDVLLVFARIKDRVFLDLVASVLIFRTVVIIFKIAFDCFLYVKYVIRSVVEIEKNIPVSFELGIYCFGNLRCL